MIKITKLAARDYLYEWRISVCHILSLAAVLGPLLILFGLKFGIVGNMLDQLIEEPRNREVRPVMSGRYDLSWFAKLGKRSEIDFIVPRKRNLASNIQLKSPFAKKILDVELIPTAKNDPLLPEIITPPANIHVIVLSNSAASKLGVKADDIIDGSVARQIAGKKQRVHLQLQVKAIASSASFNRDGAFCSLELLDALENYRDGYAVPELDWTGKPQQRISYYTGFRLFAKTIHDVAPLKKWFNEQGIDVRTRAHEIAIVNNLDENLSTVFWAIAITSLVGYVVSLGASLWANIDRKYKQLSILRLAGFRTSEILCFPIIQSLMTAVSGWFLAVLIFQLATLTIGNLMGEQLQPGQRICHLLLSHYILALLITCSSAAMAALLAGIKAIKNEPSQGLREL